MAEGDGECETARSIDDWGPVREPVVFKTVRLRRRRLALGLPACGGSKAEASSAFQPKYGPIHRSLCRIKLEELGDHEGGLETCSTTIFEFRLGDTYGYSQPYGGWSPPERAWRPPQENNRISVSPWITEAVLALGGAEAGEFETDGEPGSADVGPQCRCRLVLLDVRATKDLTGDGSVVLQVLDPGPGGEKPRDLARVSASWRVWFARNGELVLNSNVFLEEGAYCFTIDDNEIMFAIEMALREMEVGSRAACYVSEYYGSGPLTPDGNPRMNGAAVWVEAKLHKLENEMQPGSHSSVAAAALYAGEKKEQGNSCLARQTRLDVSKAVRRYNAGIAVLDAALGATPSQSSTNGDTHASQNGSEATELLTALQLNCAQAHIKRTEWKSAVEMCDQVLKREEQNAKARYRRGLARAELAELAGAVEDLRAVAVAMPTDAGVRKELKRVEALLKEHRAEEKKQFGGFVEKLEAKEQERSQREEARRKSDEDKKEKEAKARKAEQTAAMKNMRKQCEEAKAERGAREAKEAEEEAVTAAAVVADSPNPAAPAPTSPKNDTPKLKDDELGGTEWTPENLKMGASDQDLIDKVNQASSNISAPFLPQNLKTKTTEPAPPVEYAVPSFLQRKPKKSSR